MRIFGAITGMFLFLVSLAVIVTVKPEQTNLANYAVVSSLVGFILFLLCTSSNFDVENC